MRYFLHEFWCNKAEVTHLTKRKISQNLINHTDLIEITIGKKWEETLFISISFSYWNMHPIDILPTQLVELRDPVKRLNSIAILTITTTRNARQLLSKRHWGSCNVERASLRPKQTSLTPLIVWGGGSQIRCTCCMLKVVSSSTKVQKKKVESPTFDGWRRAFAQDTWYLYCMKAMLLIKRNRQDSFNCFSFLVIKSVATEY